MAILPAVAARVLRQSGDMPCFRNDATVISPFAGFASLCRRVPSVSRLLAEAKRTIGDRS